MWLTWLAGDVGAGSELGGGRRWFGWQMLGAAAQPLLLLAQGHHLVSQLLVRRPPHEPPVHVLGFDVGLHLVPSGVGEQEHGLFFMSSVLEIQGRHRDHWDLTSEDSAAQKYSRTLNLLNFSNSAFLQRGNSDVPVRYTDILQALLSCKQQPREAVCITGAPTLPPSVPRIAWLWFPGSELLPTSLVDLVDRSVSQLAHQLWNKFTKKMKNSH